MDHGGSPPFLQCAQDEWTPTGIVARQKREGVLEIAGLERNPINASRKCDGFRNRIERLNTSCIQAVLRDCQGYGVTAADGTGNAPARATAPAGAIPSRSASHRASPISPA